MLGPLGITKSINRGTSWGTNQWWLAGGINPVNAIAVYQPKGAPFQEITYTNLANPGTHNVGPGIAPTWAANTGWTFSGTEYLTGDTLASVFTGEDKPISTIASMQFDSFAGLFRTGFGFGNTSLTTSVFRTSTIYTQAKHQVQIRANDNTTPVPAVLTGNATLSVSTNYILAFTTTGLSANFYLDGADDGGPFSYNLSTITLNAFTIGALRYPTVIHPLIGKIRAIAIYNTALSASQVAAVTTAMRAL